MTEKNKTYQLTYLLSPILEQKGIEEISQKIKKWIIEKGGSLSEKENLSPGFKKNLAYPIKKYHQAFYLNFNFLLASKMVKQFNNQLNLEKDILRHFIITKQKIKSKPIQKTMNYKIVDRIEPLVDEKSSPVKKQKVEKVEIEELDKKLEEILNQ